MPEAQPKKRGILSVRSTRQGIAIGVPTGAVATALAVIINSFVMPHVSAKPEQPAPYVLKADPVYVAESKDVTSRVQALETASVKDTTQLAKDISEIKKTMELMAERLDAMRISLAEMHGDLMDRQERKKDGS